MCSTSLKVKAKVPLNTKCPQKIIIMQTTAYKEPHKPKNANLQTVIKIMLQEINKIKSIKDQKDINKLCYKG